VDIVTPASVEAAAAVDLPDDKLVQVYEA